jgi:hypothetical protein
MNNEPERTGNRFVDACVGLLVGSMALYGAVWILQSIWVWLCVIAFFVGVGALIWWRVSSKYRGW